VVELPLRIIGRQQVRDDVDETLDLHICTQTSDGIRRQVMFELGVLVGMKEQAMINQEAQDHASSCPLFARLFGQLAPAFMRLPVRHKHLTLPALPEILEIGQALALDWQAIGLQPKLVALEFPRVRALYRTKTIHGAVFPSRHGARALETVRNLHKAKDAVGYWEEHPVIEERIAALGGVVARGARARLLREIGAHKFDEFAEMPLCWLFAEAAVHPKYIAEYVFPGVITGDYTHLASIKPAP
jgi:hypothetical protein